MDPTANPLVLTKLRPPATHARAIHRARLVDALSRKDAARLLLVCAPAGYGKTTLLAEWAQSLLSGGTAVAWVSLDADDDDPVPFGAYLVGSLIQALGPLSELTQTAQYLRSSAEIELQRILPGVINAVVASERECVLILDDYHLIGSPAIHSALVYLIDHLPENLRVALGSRSDPPLQLARLRARGQLREIRTAGLRFTGVEAGQFLNEVMRLELSVEGVSMLEERTEGWIAGLQLAALSVLDRADREGYIAGFSGSQRYLVDYLMEEVIARQTDELQAFLLTTSILERMNGDLCAALFGEAIPGAETLKRLEDSNLFVVALDEQGEWYRYHHLFRDFLQARLRKARPESIPGLHKAACAWLVEHHLLREAARQAFLSQDMDYAVAFVEQHSFTLIVYSEIATIYEWCSAFPEEVMQHHPMLCILQALALAYGSRRQNSTRIKMRLAQAESLIAKIEDRDDAQSLIDMQSVVRTFLAFAPDPCADPQELLALARQMTGAYPDNEPGQFSGLLVTGYAHLAAGDARAAEIAFQTARQIAVNVQLYFGLVESCFYLARLALSRGRPREAVEICQQARADLAALLPHPEQTLPAVGSLDILEGCALLEQDQLNEAEDLLRRGLERMGGGMNPYYLMTAYTALFRLCEIQGRAESGRKYLDGLETIWPDLEFFTRGLKARQALRAAPREPRARAEASAWAQEFEAATGGMSCRPGMGPLGAAEVYYQATLIWAEVQIRLENPHEALAYLEQQIQRAEANGLAQRVMGLSVLQALGQQEAGDDRAAVQAIERALGVARASGYAHIFDPFPSLAALLNPKEGQVFLSRGLPYGAAGTAMSYGESLSERELEVLRLIAEGASNQEVAERLVITVGTVKSHMNHILGKLDAHNRTEAVARARALGLIEI